ncbi:hypothetical protein R3P38DRAFT_3515986 [Favolaschia claudopus]|uniref:Uncharacterized protein n=1 Tax=Favolaschia claudopus TaxID=2862362 RepID=A0AAW0BQT3_9AGAR
MSIRNDPFEMSMGESDRGTEVLSLNLMAPAIQHLGFWTHLKRYSADLLAEGVVLDANESTVIDAPDPNSIRSHVNTILRLTAENQQLHSALSNLQETTSTTMKKLRAERKAFKMQARRAQESLATVRGDFKAIATWDAKDGQMYSMLTRRLVLRISGAGCPENKVKDVILSCAGVFGVNAKNLTLSAPSVARMKKEGRYISLIQIGREIEIRSHPAFKDTTWHKGSCSRVQFTQFRKKKIKDTWPAVKTAQIPVFSSW